MTQDDMTVNTHSSVCAKHHRATCNQQSLYPKLITYEDPRKLKLHGHATVYISELNNTVVIKSLSRGFQ